jgi:hypothetical protein
MPLEYLVPIVNALGVPSAFPKFGSQVPVFLFGEKSSKDDTDSNYFWRSVLLFFFGKMSCQILSMFKFLIGRVSSPIFLLATLIMALYKMQLPIKLKLVWGGLPLLLQYKIEKKKTY